MRWGGLWIALAALLVHRQDGGTAEGQAVEPFDAWSATLAPLEEPSALAIGENGAILVAEAAADRVRFFDAAGRELSPVELAAGSAGGGSGELRDPRGVEALTGGGFLVSDGGNHRVVRFDREGRLAGAFGSWGSGPGNLCAPEGIACDGERVLVADSRNDRVAVFSLAGGWLASFGGRGGEPGRFRRPLDLALDGEGHVYVADADNHRVQKLDARGGTVLSFGEHGPHPGLFSSPCGVEWAGGRLYVADRDNHRVQVFDGRGTLLHQWGVHALRPREHQGKLHFPDRLAISPFGNFAVVAESFENRCQVFRRRERGSDPEAWVPPQEAAASAHYGPRIAARGTLLALTEPALPAALLFDASQEDPGADPINVTRIAAHGSGLGSLRRPLDVAIDAERRLLYVADPGNGRLDVFAFARLDPLAPRYDPRLLRLARSLSFERLEPPPQAGAVGPIEPDALELDAEGGIRLVDRRNRAVFALSPDLRVVGVHTGGTRRFLDPVDAAFSRDGRVLFVVDRLARQVVALPARESGAEPLFAWGGPGRGEGAFARPAGIAAGIDGFVYVADEALHRVQKFDEEGRFVAALGESALGESGLGASGLGAGQFYKPTGLAQDGRGRLYVLDWGNHRLQVFSADGAFALAFGARLFTSEARRR